MACGDIAWWRALTDDNESLVANGASLTSRLIRTGCKFSIAQTLLASAKVAGNRLIRGRCSQKNGWYFVAAHGTGMR
jgi:hypothetical protein